MCNHANYVSLLVSEYSAIMGWERFGLDCLFTHSVTYVTLDTSITDYYCNTTYTVSTSKQYNIINNNTKFKGQLEAEFVTTSRYVYIYINIPKS